ncbi:tripartite tricarboxylate transporter substrate binding protein [Bordetella sp. BOR01]|uniref:Bug family tripartite tricarboxylate transporter substrate binding protein n=1 Tax=Bordetella sp. BOR01 TaxID=2854779 RepID=UPI001C463521|nr:tripartite tricarboxylate transporter substrate binding protein [Bordetella sp. BOR01]MBV7483920.1 tripartite tricarboxylate transporter substrate binding protein [Bordetella sp. BOR01]
MIRHAGSARVLRGIFQCLLGLGLSAGILPAHAQASFPAKPVHLLVPAPPGGAGDTSARAIARHMAQTLNQQVVVENKPGAAATIGFRSLASSAPDGYTIGLVPVAGTAIATVTYKDLPDIERDFTIVAGIADAPHMLVVPASLGIKDVKGLLALLKNRPDYYNYASQGAGSLSHIESAVFLAAAGVSATHVPYKGSSEAIPGLISGETSMMFDSVTSVLSHVRAGKLTALATAASSRVPQLPDVPTMAELGYDLKADNAFVLLAPANTPREAMQVLTEAVRKAVQSPEVIATLENTGIVAKFTAPDAFGTVISQEFALWPDLARKLVEPSR